MFHLLVPPSIERGYPLTNCALTAFSLDGLSTRTQQFDNPTVLSARGIVSRQVDSFEWQFNIARYLVNLLNRQGILAHIDESELIRCNQTRHKAQQTRIGSSKVSFAWQPFLHNATNEWIGTLKQTFKPDLVVFSLGLHDLLYSNEQQIQTDLD